jgi:TolA-binding protein
MAMKEIKAKILKGEALTDEEKAYLEKYEEPDTNAAAAAARKAAQGEAQKKLDEMKTQLDDLQSKFEEKVTELEETKGGKLSDTQKLQKSIEQMQKRIDKMTVDISEKDKALAEKDRQHNIDRIAARHKIVNGVDPEIFRIGLERSLKDIEDLTDENAIKDAITPFLEKNKSIIAVDNPGGAGSRAGGVGGGFGGDKKTYTHAEAVQYLNSAEKGSKERKAIREELFKAEAEGRIKKE